MSGTQENYFDKLFSQLQRKNKNYCSYCLTIEAYLYRKPIKDDEFWQSKFVFKIPKEQFETEEFILALARYFTLEQISNFPLINQIASQAPSAITRAIRRSQIVLNKSHVKWDEIRVLSAQSSNNELNTLISTCQQFQKAHQERLDLVKEFSKQLESLSLFEFMSLSAAYSYKHMVEPVVSLEGKVIKVNNQLIANTALMKWKLQQTESDEFLLNDQKIALQLKKCLAPLIFPSSEDSSEAEAYLQTYSQLMQAQVELDEFISQSVHPFCFDDSLHYDVKGGRLELKFLNEKYDNWDRNGRRAKLLRGYWFNIGINEFVKIGMAEQLIGTEENHELNQIAFVKALANFTELQSVYGLTSSVTTASGFNVDLFKALLSLELMSAFYTKEHIVAFNNEYSGDWRMASGIVAMRGLAIGENRFPITWSLWKQKAKNIVGWTVSDVLPKGSIKASEAILNFWCTDLKQSCVALKNGSNKLHPLQEKPIFKMGNYCIQLPWIMSTQLSSLNAVNNLRRYANLRGGLKEETTRIEEQLGNKFSERGFEVVNNHTSPSLDGKEAGEIDLICALSDIVFIIEVKSTYQRTSKSEIYYHRDRTLRKAGIQVRKKVDVITSDIATDETLRHKLKLKTTTPKIVGLIADTSIEFDHEHFCGFLKVSVEELLIALADNAHYLCDLEEVTQSQTENQNLNLSEDAFTLYEKGFNAETFLDVIVESKVWRRHESQS